VTAIDGFTVQKTGGRKSSNIVDYALLPTFLIDLARNNALNLGAGHTFIIFLRDMFPVNILNTIKAVPEVCSVFCATAKPVEVLFAESTLGRGIMGVIGGYASKDIEGEADIAKRKSFLRAIGYKQ
jgi:adenosine/AMP kinase